LLNAGKREIKKPEKSRKTEKSKKREKQKRGKKDERNNKRYMENYMIDKTSVLFETFAKTSL